MFLQGCIYIFIERISRSYQWKNDGNRYKLNKQGEPYGWPANIYDRVENWAPSEWIENSCNIDVEESRETIINTGLSVCKGMDIKQLTKTLSLK
ncbi:AlkZ-related protein [Ruminiclostridium cellulolyticum]|uniref:AlkZ-related protein n=1 Tax=Ruminiclostridium cellulolyticum TaxID=1521 RepID=UPI003BF494E8